MKKFTYPLSDNDIQTLMDALAVMVNVIPDSDLFPPETIDLALGNKPEKACHLIRKVKTRINTDSRK